MTEAKTFLIVRVGLLIIVVLFTLFGFFIKQDCDIDAIYLWCRLHPMSIGDIFGTILFYGGAFGLSGLWKNWVSLNNPKNSSFVNIAMFIGIALGIFLIWA